jgi:hypothetical protein
MLGHLCFQDGFEHRLGQPSQQATLANQLHPLGTSMLHEFLSKLLLINRAVMARSSWSLLALPAKHVTCVSGESHHIGQSHFTR